MKIPLFKNYLSHYSLRLLVGHSLLALPTLFAVFILEVWRIDILLLPPLLGIIGWVLILPLTYTIARPSKERVAIDACSGGLLMLCLCSITASLQYMRLTESLSFPESKGEDVRVSPLLPSKIILKNPNACNDCVFHDKEKSK